MNIEYLKSFFVVADTLNFTKAAQLLHISQPALTKQIKALETQLGSELFIRDTHNVTLTPVGHVLADRGQSILVQIDRVKKHILSETSENETVIRISCADYYNPKFFDFLWDYQHDNPDVIININHLNSRRSIERLRFRDVDLVVTYDFANNDEPDEFNSLKIDQNRFRLLVSHKHPWAKLSSITMEQLLQEKNIKIDPNMLPSLTEMKTRDPKSWNVLLHDAARRREGRILSEDVLLMVRAGECCAMIPGSVAELHGIGCKAVDIRGVDTSFNVVMLWNKLQQNAKIKHFINAAQTVFEKAPDNNDTI